MKARYFILLSAIFIVLGLLARAQDHRAAITMAKSIVSADNVGGVDVAPSIDSLKRYSGSHTGAGVTFSLVGSYNRDKAQAEAAAKQAAGNGALYAQAQAACASHADSIQQANCVQSYLGSHITNQAVAPTVTAPDPNRYIYILKSPPVAADIPTLFFAIALLALIMSIATTRRQRK